MDLKSVLQKQRDRLSLEVRKKVAIKYRKKNVSISGLFISSAVYLFKYKSGSITA